MDAIWADILARFGQEVTLKKDGQKTTFRALVQPILNQNQTKELPDPLGIGQNDIFRYMGPAGFPLGPDTLVEWHGKDFRVQSAHLVGQEICPHWWAMLYPRDEVNL